jgi:hypothetical protein
VLSYRTRLRSDLGLQWSKTFCAHFGVGAPSVAATWGRLAKRPRLSEPEQTSEALECQEEPKSSASAPTQLCRYAAVAVECEIAEPPWHDAAVVP